MEKLNFEEMEKVHSGRVSASCAESLICLAIGFAGLVGTVASLGLDPIDWAVGLSASASLIGTGFSSAASFVYCL